MADSVGRPWRYRDLWLRLRELELSDRRVPVLVAWTGLRSDDGRAATYGPLDQLPDGETAAAVVLLWATRCELTASERKLASAYLSDRYRAGATS